MTSTKKKMPAPRTSALRKALLGLYGIIGLLVSTFGPVKVPFAENHAKEYWRHALAGIILLLALLPATIGLAIYLFDANDFKSQMVEYVKIHLQRDLIPEGDIKVTFFPNLGLESGRIQLGQRNSSKAFASIEHTRLHIAWWPLLRKHLQIRRIELDGVHADIIRYQDGSTNFDDLLVADGSLSDVQFKIDSIVIGNSSINFTDAASGTLLTMRDLNIETGRLADSTPGNLSANFRLGLDKPRIDARIQLTSHVYFELRENRQELANIEGSLAGDIAGFNDISLNFQGNINNQPALGLLAIDRLVASAKWAVGDNTTETKLDIPNLQLNKEKFTGKFISMNAKLSRGNENSTASLKIPSFVMTNKILLAEKILADFDLSMAGGSVQGKLGSPLSVDFGNLVVKLPEIAGSLGGIHPGIAGKMNANATGNMLINMSEQDMKLIFRATMDDSNFTGNVRLHDFTSPAVSLDLAINRLDLDRYLAKDWAGRLRDDALPFYFGGLKTVNFRGKLHSNEFKVAGLKVKKLVADIRAGESGLLIEPLSARLYGGTMLGSFGIDASELPKITLRQKLTGIRFNNLLADIMPDAGKFAGDGNLALDLNATGENMGALRKTINGHISLALARGALPGINLAAALVAGKNQLGMTDGEHNEPANFTESTSFSELKSTFEIIDGNVHSRDFLMRSPLFVGKGEGDIDLHTGQLNYRLTTAITPTLKRSRHGALSELAGINVPLRISGPWATPLITLDFGAASGGKMAKPVLANRAGVVAVPVKTPVGSAKPAGKRSFSAPNESTK